VHSIITHRDIVVPYPLADVIGVSIAMGPMVALLGLVLRPPASWRLWSRIALRTGYALRLLFLMALGSTADLRSIDYVPSRLALATLLLLIIWTT
jgi:hypothetical protein